MKPKKSIVNIANIQRKLKISLKSVRYIVKTALENLYCGSYELDIIFCSPAYIKKLNNNYRSKDAATDVLSFEIKESVGDVFYIGEIYIAPSVAMNNFLKYRDFWEKDDWVIGEKQKSIKNTDKDYRKGFDKELALLLIHGILHLFGYVHDEDHKLNLDDDNYDKDMKDMQKFIYKELVKIL